MGVYKRKPHGFASICGYGKLKERKGKEEALGKDSEKHCFWLRDCLLVWNQYLILWHITTLITIWRRSDGWEGEQTVPAPRLKLYSCRCFPLKQVQWYQIQSLWLQVFWWVPLSLDYCQYLSLRSEHSILAFQYTLKINRSPGIF